MSDTRTLGFLRPAVSPAPEDDAALDAVIQQWVVGLTGLPGSLVRPRYQPAPPPQPDQGVNWCAVGVMSQTPDANAWFGHNPAGGAGLGDSSMQRHEVVEALASFYGPAAMGMAGLVRDGAQLGQNRDLLTVHGMALVGTETIRLAPDLINQIWVRRADLPIVFRRQIDRVFQVRTLVSVEARIATDHLPPAIVSPPVQVANYLTGADGVPLTTSTGESLLA